ncbi:MAG: regulatory protein RecX [Leucobacter sp.]|nr:regulatory protein RecX [Leucobacter sp.]
MVSEEAYKEAMQRALKLLERRDYAEGELIDKLKQKGIEEETAAKAAERLTELGYINDKKFAAILVRHYSAKGFGPGKIRSEFIKRRVPREFWDEALSEFPESVDKVYSLLLKKLGTKERSRENISKASASAARRGFSWEEINDAVQRLLYEEDYEE